MTHSSSPYKRVRILILGICEAVVECLSLAFAGQLTELEVADSTEEGLQRLASEDFDIILTNLGYQGPRGHMDRKGFALIPRLRAIRQDVPVVIITGAGFCPELIEEARRVGAFKVFFTPFAIDRKFRESIYSAIKIGKRLAASG